MNQNIWGSHMWFSLHTITFNYPLKPSNEDIQNYKNFFLSFKNVIPCSICKKNYIRHLNELPIDNVLDSRKKLVYWLIDMHNMVNGEIGKKIWSYDEVIKKYEEVYGKKIILDSNNNKISIEHFNNEKNKENNQENNIYYKKMIINYFFIFFIILLIINLFIMIYKHK
jgi:hypothetical protein